MGQKKVAGKSGGQKGSCAVYVEGVLHGVRGSVRAHCKCGAVQSMWQKGARSFAQDDSGGAATAARAHLLLAEDEEAAAGYRLPWNEACRQGAAVCAAAALRPLCCGSSRGLPSAKQLLYGLW